MVYSACESAALPPWMRRVIWSLLLEERARHAADLQQREAKIASRDEEIERLSRIIRDLQRMSFGARSEKMDPDQLALALEDVEQELAAAEVRAATPEQKAARGPPDAELTVAACRHICPAWSR